MKKKNITINDLARMVKRGFDGVDKSFEKTATVEHVNSQFNGLKNWAEGKFKNIDKRFDKIENILLAEQNRKIEKLEMRIEYLENILNVAAKKQ